MAGRIKTELLPVSNFTASQNSASAYLAFDANKTVSNYWESISAPPQWIQADLGLLYKLQGFTIQNYSGSGSFLITNYRIEASSDNLVWDEIVPRTAKVSSTVEFSIDLPNSTKTYRYVKLHINTVNTGTKTIIQDFSILGEIPVVNKILISSSIGETISFQKGGYADLIPKMTSNTSPSGLAFAKSIYSTAFDAWYAFNKVDDAEGYASASGSVGIGYLGYRFNKLTRVMKYSIKSIKSSNLNLMPKNWTFEGSLNTTNGTDGTWIVLDTQTNQTWVANNTDKEYEINNKNEYISYRLNWTANNGNTGYTDVNEFMMYDLIPSKVTLIPSQTEQNFINHGMDKPTELDLSSKISTRAFIEQAPTTLGSGKVFKKSIDTAQVPIKKVTIK